MDSEYQLVSGFIKCWPNLLLSRDTRKEHRYRDRRRGNSQIGINPQSTSPPSSSLEKLFFHTAILLSQSAQSRNPISALASHIIPATTQTLCKFSVYLHFSRGPIFHREAITTMQSNLAADLLASRIHEEHDRESPPLPRSRSKPFRSLSSLNFSLTLHLSAPRPRFFCTRSVSIKG